jgi:hypothetical protein
MLHPFLKTAMSRLTSAAFLSTAVSRLTSAGPVPRACAAVIAVLLLAYQKRRSAQPSANQEAELQSNVTSSLLDNSVAVAVEDVEVLALKVGKELERTLKIDVIDYVAKDQPIDGVIDNVGSKASQLPDFLVNQDGCADGATDNDIDHPADQLGDYTDADASNQDHAIGADSTESLTSAWLSPNMYQSWGRIEAHDPISTVMAFEESDDSTLQEAKSGDDRGSHTAMDDIDIQNLQHIAGGDYDDGTTNDAERHRDTTMWRSEGWRGSHLFSGQLIQLKVNNTAKEEVDSALKPTARNETTVSAKKKRKKRKDPKIPKRAKTSYMYFVHLNHDRVKSENPAADFGQLVSVALHCRHV